MLLRWSKPHQGHILSICPRPATDAVQRLCFQCVRRELHVRVVHPSSLHPPAILHPSTRAVGHTRPGWLFLVGLAACMMHLLPFCSLGFREFFVSPHPARLPSLPVHTTTVRTVLCSTEDRAGLEFLLPMVRLGSASCDGGSSEDHPRCCYLRAGSRLLSRPRSPSGRHEVDFDTCIAVYDREEDKRDAEEYRMQPSQPGLHTVSLPLWVKAGALDALHRRGMTQPLPWLPHLNSYLLAPRSLPCFSSIRTAPGPPNVIGTGNQNPIMAR